MPRGKPKPECGHEERCDCRTVAARSTLDAAVERLVRQGYAALELSGKNEREARECIKGLIRDTYELGRQSAARECAEIADEMEPLPLEIGPAIRRAFNLEGK